MIGDGERQGSEEEIVTYCELDAPPEKVWRALTVPELIGAWLLPTDFVATVGRDFVFAGASAGLGAQIDCKLLAAEPNRLLRYSWRENRDDLDEPVDTMVTFYLRETAAGKTRLLIVHSSVPCAARTVTAAPANSNTRPRLRLAA